MRASRRMATGTASDHPSRRAAKAALLKMRPAFGSRRDMSRRSEMIALSGWIDKLFLQPEYATLVKDKIEFRNIHCSFTASQFI